MFLCKALAKEALRRPPSEPAIMYPEQPGQDWTSQIPGELEGDHAGLGNGAEHQDPWVKEPERWGGAGIAYISQFTVNPQKETSHAPASSRSEERFRDMKIGTE